MRRESPREGRGWRPKTWRGRIGIAVLLVGTAAWLIANSPLFSISEIRVRGNDRLSPAEIIEMSGVATGTNLLTLSLDQTERMLLADPWILSAEAARDLPSTLDLRVGERRPVATAMDPEGPVLVAEDGMVLERAAQAQLVTIAETREALEPGDLIEDADVSLRVAAVMPPRLHGAARSIDIEGDEVVLSLRGGGRVLMGRPVDLAAKARAASSMLRYAARRDMRIDYIDVRAPAAPALKPVGGPEEG